MVTYKTPSSMNLCERYKRLSLNSLSNNNVIAQVVTDLLVNT